MSLFVVAIVFTDRGVCQASPWIRPGSEDPQLLSAGSWINTIEYIPTARGPFDGFWEMLRGEEKAPTPKISEWLEFDLYEHNKFAVEKLATEGDDTAL